jgi:hypothetical protein
MEKPAKSRAILKSLFVAQPRPTAGPHPHHNTLFAAKSSISAYGATRFELSSTSFQNTDANVFIWQVVND